MVLGSNCVRLITIGSELNLSTNSFNVAGVFIGFLIDFLTPEEYFDFIQTRHESPSPKPYPDGINSVLKLLGLARNEAMYIGDALMDGTAATRAGVEFWGVSTGETSETSLFKAGAKHVVSSLADLIPLVRERLDISTSSTLSIC